MMEKDSLNITRPRTKNDYVMTCSVVKNVRSIPYYGTFEGIWSTDVDRKRIRTKTEGNYEQGREERQPDGGVQ